MSFEKELVYREYIQREEEFLRAPYNPEIEFYSYIQAGDVNKVEQMCIQQPFSEKAGLGTLSKDRLRNMKYHFVITTALVARYCINAGMEYSKAYNISDMYIQKADLCTSINQLAKLHPVMCVDYARRMKKIIQKTSHSQHITNAIDYIYNHLHTRIKIETLAEYVGINPTYLSKLFTNEMGCSVSYYIMEKKIDTAKRMLVYSEYSNAQIASTLAFASQSYFTEVFKKKTGKTPNEYRKTATLESLSSFNEPS